MLNWIPKYLQPLLNAIFDREAEQKNAWWGWTWLTGLYLSGVFLWGKFLNWGRIPFDFHDWAEVNAPRMAFLRDAVIKGVLPLHMPDASALRGITDRFMALPDVVLSPQIILMRFMDVGTFILIDTLIFYSLGVLGLLWIRKRYGLSLIAFSALFFLFNFNGHILAHYSVGHITWAGYFLFPWVFALIFQLLDGDHSWAWAARMALLLFFMYLQGSFHQFVWVLIFLGILAITSWNHFWPVFKAGVFAVLLSMVRILPPTLHLGQFDDEFLGGYPSLMDVLNSLVTIKFPEQSLDMRSMLSTLGWWEYSLYLGLAGTACLIFFGIYRWLKNPTSNHAYPQLLIPIFVMFLLSIGRVYRLVRIVPIPLFSGERASIRMLILPVALLLILAAIELQAWIRSRKQTVPIQMAELGVLLLIVHDLWQNLKAWQVTNAFNAFPLTPVNLSIKTVANHPDAPYLMILGIGAGISFLSFLVLMTFTWKEKKRSEKRNRQ